MKVPAIGDVLFPGDLNLEVKEIKDNVVFCESERGSYEIPTAVFDAVDLSIASK